MDVVVNYGAVLAAAVSAIVLGFLWYGPIFGKAWMKEMGMTKESIKHSMKGRSAAMVYGLQAVGALLMAYVLLHGLIFGNAYLNMSGILSGIQGAFWFWLGFVAPVTLSAVLWEGKSWKYWGITAGYYLVTLLVMGAILTAWN